MYQYLKAKEEAEKTEHENTTHGNGSRDMPHPLDWHILSVASMEMAERIIAQVRCAPVWREAVRLNTAVLAYS